MPNYLRELSGPMRLNNNSTQRVTTVFRVSVSVFHPLTFIDVHDVLYGTT